MVFTGENLKKKVIDSLPFGAIVVDDKKYVVEELLKRKDLTVYWLDRQKSDEGLGLNRISSLNEVVKKVLG